MGRIAILASSVLLAAFLMSCGGSRKIVVGAKNFTEQLILGEMIAQQIEHCAGLPVERRFHLGGTLLAHQAMLSGEIDVYPEYTGTALMTVLKESPSGGKNAVFARVRNVYRERFGIEWLEALGFENTFAMAVRGELARQKGWHTLSDAARSGFAFRLGVGYEFEQREDGLPGFLKTYPMRLDGAPRAMDLGLLYKAIEQDQVDMVAGGSTDGMIDVMGLQVLEDDRGYFPPYEAAVVVRGATAIEYPRLTGCLGALSGTLSATRIRGANQLVDESRVPLEAIALRLLQVIAAPEPTLDTEP